MSETVYTACNTWSVLAAMQPTQGWGSSDFCWDNLPPTTKPAGLLRAKAGYGSGAAALSARLHQSLRVESDTFTFKEQEAVMQPPGIGGLPGRPSTEQTVAGAGKGQPAGTPPPRHQQQQQQRLGQRAPPGARPPVPQRAYHTLDRQAGDAAQDIHAGGSRTGGPVAGGNCGATAPAATVAAPAPAAGAGAAIGGSAASAAPVRTDLTLEKYLEFHAHLTKGSSSVQQLSELEKSVLKVSDLKQASPMNASVRTRSSVTAPHMRTILQSCAPASSLNIVCPSCCAKQHQWSMLP